MPCKSPFPEQASPNTSTTSRPEGVMLSKHSSTNKSNITEKYMQKVYNNVWGACWGILILSTPICIANKASKKSCNKCKASQKEIGKAGNIRTKVKELKVEKQEKAQQHFCFVLAPLDQFDMAIPCTSDVIEIALLNPMWQCRANHMGLMRCCWEHHAYFVIVFCLGFHIVHKIHEVLLRSSWCTLSDSLGVCLPNYAMQEYKSSLSKRLYSIGYKRMESSLKKKKMSPAAKKVDN